MTAATPDSEPGHRRDISPDGTHVRMSLARFLSIVGGIAIAVGAGMGIYWNLRAHESNAHIHLREDFEVNHGAPVGERDLEASKRDTAQAVDTVVKVRLEQFVTTINAKRKP